MININKKIMKIALQRCSEPDRIKDFLYPEKADLMDPFKLKGVREACEKIKSSINNQNKILIYGDYDADGITSTALLYKALLKIHNQIFYYIPQRDGEGYGLNKEALNKFIDQGIDLVITVDCGIKSNDLVDEFTKKGLQFIITDHHIPDEITPQAIIVNPKLSKEEVFYDLAGVGVAYNIARGLGMEFESIKKIDSDLLQLAALGTVADLVNLSMENRKIVRKGLVELNSKPLQGIKSLVEKNELLEINSKSIAFLLAPIINSSGRMGTPELALKLLILENKSETDALADELIILNNKRKTLVEEVYKEAQKIILENQYFSDPIIIVEKEKWPQGILGIVASRILNEYNRSVILLTENENGIYKGSGRSIDNYNIFHALKKHENIIEEFGGHAQAAGLSILKENISLLRDNLNSDIFKNLNHKDFYKEFQLDGSIKELDEISKDLYRDLALLEPFGTGNPEPIFKFENPVNITSRRIGKLKDHLKMDISQDNKKIDGIYFNYQELPKESKENNLIFSVGINEWRNKVSLQLEVKEIIKGEKIEAQKIEQKIYGDLLSSQEKPIKDCTIGERIKYNDLWDILKNSKGLIYSKNRKTFLKEQKSLINQNLYIYDNEKNFPNNFKNLQEYIFFKTEAVLLTDSLLLKNKILKVTNNYIFIDEEPRKNVLYYLKRQNPEIKIYIIEDLIKRKKISREKLSHFYLIVRKIYTNSNNFNLSEIESIVKKSGKIKMNKEEIVTGIMIFEELGFLEYSLGNEILEIELRENPEKTQLDSSRLYKILNYK